ncbi:MAG: aminotransferase class I/II-fold pyridoxal phosphate-dependent enzyme [Acidimicrobiales bacterium]
MHRGPLTDDRPAATEPFPAGTVRPGPTGPGRTLPPPGRHGGDGPAVAAALGMDPADLLDLSQNLNPFAPDPGPVVARHLDTVGLYPDPGPATAALAERLGVDRSRLLITNGGSGAIALVAAELGGRPWAEPDFGLYPREAGGPRWRSDPHSPSGALAPPGLEAQVWDEAFYPLATGAWTAGRSGVTIGSLTKTFACPGLRLGYLIADDAARFARRQPPWSVGALALAALVDLIAAADLPAWSAAVAEARADLVAVLTARDLAVTAADAPWVLVAAPGLRARLAPHGVLIRDCTSFGRPDLARIAVPGPEGLRRLTSALDRSR